MQLPSFSDTNPPIVSFSDWVWCLAVKILEQPGVDVVEGQALRYKCEDVDIFSNSWGPGDSGQTMEGMGTLSGTAMEKCLQIVRIFLFRFAVEPC
jgi:hypothetical protein